ncbi:BFD-like [2Fe-2S] binding domain-containing protein [Mariniphaga anaerophila]|uniref:Bacterioferritin-associated ferredoxin n=1 Tax=Mariniphaga anaerophila TaxID=1484053 RepID=A0A1M4VRL9_9BACT|nr:(2Fe-2S)-binding protein [Mariniphaga anaerophila]SHE71497.1 BFD-like [2Fe-2S] binding domain-containing protein [Mariniphaga anaerophila]
MARIVCLCNWVDKKEIEAALKKGATSTGEIQKLTLAGTSCGRCLPEIDQLVSDFINKKPKDPQKKLDFDF